MAYYQEPRYLPPLSLSNLNSHTSRSPQTRQQNMAYSQNFGPTSSRYPYSNQMPPYMQSPPPRNFVPPRERYQPPPQTYTQRSNVPSITNLSQNNISTEPLRRNFQRPSQLSPTSIPSYTSFGDNQSPTSMPPYYNPYKKKQKDAITSPGLQKIMERQDQLLSNLVGKMNERTSRYQERENQDYAESLQRLEASVNSYSTASPPGSKVLEQMSPSFDMASSIKSHKKKARKKKKIPKDVSSSKLLYNVMMVKMMQDAFGTNKKDDSSESEDSPELKPKRNSGMQQYPQYYPYPPPNQYYIPQQQYQPSLLRLPARDEPADSDDSQEQSDENDSIYQARPKKQLSSKSMLPPLNKNKPQTLQEVRFQSYPRAETDTYQQLDSMKGSDGFSQRSKSTTKRKKTTKKRKSKVIEEEEEKEDPAEAEERKRKEKERKEAALKRLRIHVWTMVYPGFFISNSKKQIKKKQTTIEGVFTNKMMNMERMFHGYVKQNAQDQLKKLFKASYNYMDYDQESNKAKKVCQELTNCLKAVLDKLISNTKKLPNEFFEFVASLSESGARLPSGYFSDFELRRLEFNNFGLLKDTKESNSSIVIAGLVLIRMFLHENIMQAQKKFGISTKPKQLLHIGSYFYNTVMEYIKTASPMYRNCQQILPNEFNIEPKKSPMYSLDPSLLSKFEFGKNNRGGEICEGYFSKNQLACFYVENRQHSDLMKTLIVGWIKVIYKRAHEIFETKKKTIMIPKTSAD